MALAIGTRLDHYQLLALLGVGGMGEVYRAHDNKLHSVEEADGAHFPTMELVEGQSLAELIPARGVTLERSVDIATAVETP